MLTSCCFLQVVHLDKDEEMQKLPLQPPYYDMAPSESTPFTDKPVRADFHRNPGLLRLCVDFRQKGDLLSSSCLELVIGLRC